MAGSLRRCVLLTVLVGLAACASPKPETVQAPAAAPVAAPAAPVLPRLADGKPNFQGNWYKAGGFGGGGGGGRGGGNPAAAPVGGNPAAGPVADAPPAPVTGNTNPFAGGGGGRGGPPRDPNAFYERGQKIPYTPEALRERRWRAAHGTLDGEPLCQLAGTPRGHTQPPYPHVIIQDEKQIVILYEYVHEPRIIPLDGRASAADNSRTWMGQQRGHWEGDTLVVETKGYNGRVWMNMAGDWLDENLTVVEKFAMKDANTYSYEAVLTDPTVLSEPFVYKFDHRRQPDSDILLSYDCLEGEDDVHHYTADDGGAGGVKQVKQPAAIYGCLRANPAGSGDFTYTVVPLNGAPIKLTPSAGLKATLPELMDREVKFDGKWLAKDSNFSAVYADVHATGCRWDGKPWDY